MNRRELGDIGEAMASSFLIERGMEVVGRQVQVGRGEIDLVARDGNEIVIVEVKTRASLTFGMPEEAVTERKVRQLTILGERYVNSIGWLGSWRVDVVSVIVGGGAQEDPVTHIQGVDSSW